MAFRAVLAAAAPPPARKTFHSQVGSASTIYWPGKNCWYRDGRRRQLVASTWAVVGTRVCRSNATGLRFARCWFWEIDPMPSRKTSAVHHAMFFPENGTAPSRFRNGIPCHRWLVALRKACGMPVANGGVMEKLKPLHCLAFVVITLFLASCASQTQPATTSTTTSGTTQSKSPLDREGGNGLASMIH